jgi:hypothetical protein
VNDDAKAILQSLLAEIEDLRALQTVLLHVLRAQPQNALLDFEELKRVIREKNRPAYDELRQTIDELT